MNTSSDPGIQGKNVLVVEDDGLIREYIVMYLEASGHRARSVSCPEDAIPFLPNSDVVMIDYYINGKSCDAFIDYAAKENPNTTIIVTSGDGGAAMETAARIGGIALCKPYMPDDLLKAVESHPSAEDESPTPRP